MNNPTDTPQLIAPRAILFDLDGTLIDTAPDLVEATQRVLDDHQMPRLLYEQLRPVCSQGAKGLLSKAFNIDPILLDTPQYQSLFNHWRKVFLNHYQQCLTTHTCLFKDIEDLLRRLQDQHIDWGIVTNKATDLTTPIVQALLINQGLIPQTVICGDTTAHAKPHPLPLLTACKQLNVAPENTWYVGDDRRDIISAIAAGCIPIAVSYGYHSEQDPPNTWGAVYTVDSVKAFEGVLDKAYYD
jgi:N-acetyl-D-muramate 6-phosphate phosphatase